jgi:hypothetical protein
MRTAILLTALLLLGCPPAEEILEPEPTPDDDPTPPEPLDGSWDGTTMGVVVYGQMGSYPCEGTGSAEVDDDWASGVVSCTFAHTGDVCTFAFEAFPVGGGQSPDELSDCFGGGEATYSLWAANGFLYGRVQRLAEELSVEITWALAPVED